MEEAILEIDCFTTLCLSIALLTSEGTPAKMCAHLLTEGQSSVVKLLQLGMCK